MGFALNIPLNKVSFGQVSFGLLKEILNRSMEPSLSLLGGALDLSSQSLITPQLQERIQFLIRKYIREHSRDTPCIKLWHLNGSLESISEKQLLISFYELDSPTQAELNAAKNNKTYFTSQYTVDEFQAAGVKTHYLPLFFDHLNFRKIDKDYFDDGRIVFNLCGKFERRKHHAKVLSAWANKYGGDNRYVLQCALYNHFLSPEDNEKAFMMALGGKKYSNIHILSPMEKNAQYNDFLNSADIILGMSGGEGWGLPEFHSTALGKHSVILNAHGYKGWADEFNSCLVEPSGKTECYDGTFFLKGAEFNQGSIYDWEEDAFIDACEKAIERRKAGKVNEHGLSLQQDFTVQKTVDTLLKGLEDM